MVYASAVVKLDMSTPAILKGVAAKAKRGRVDAARLALELTGRHNPKGDQQPAQVAVIIGGVPRPRAITTDPDGQVIIEANEAMIAEDQDV
jgi:glucose/arabinose dehydrogenase